MTQRKQPLYRWGLKALCDYKNTFISWLQSWLCRQPASTTMLYQPPAFDTFTYAIAVPPQRPKGIAWDKLAECERRLEMYQWVERLNDPRSPQHRVLLDDCVSAFLLTFEATLQFVNDQFSKSSGMPTFNTWIKQLLQHDLHVRGLRTLRHFAAHVEIKPIPSLVALVIGGSLPDGTSATTVSRAWQLPELQDSDLRQLITPVLQPGDLPNWNVVVKQSDVASVFTHGLHQLRDILLEAEKLL